MSCFHGYDFTHGHEDAFSVEASQVCFGPGVLKEAGAHLAAAGLKRVALFTDVQVRAAGHTLAVEQSLRAAGVDVVLYDSVHVEPTNVSFEDAARFAREAKVDGYVSVGGGSVMDTCKAALLYATYAPTERFSLTPSIEYASDRWSDVTGGGYVETGEYCLFDIQAEYRFNRNVRLAVGGRNLADKDYELAWGFPQEGRTFFAKIDIVY